MSSAWKPLPGPQTQALESQADTLFYGGAAGGGKTDLLIGAAHTQHQRTIIFRREYPQFRAIIDRTEDIFFGAGKFIKSDMIWELKDGRIIEFGAVQHEGDERRYQGRSHDLKAFDELAHFSERQFRTLCGWLRSADPEQRCRVLATGNPPTGSDGDWIIRFFAPWLDKTCARPALPGELRWYTTIDGKETEVESGEAFEHKGEWIVPKSRTFIPAHVEDNPYYMASGYKAVLQALPEPLRAQLLYGDFQAGQADDDFQVIPSEWLEKAIKRWDAGKPNVPLSCIGVDVARGGKDRTVITLRYDNWFDTQRVYEGRLTTTGDSVAQRVFAAGKESKCRINVDVIGVGTSVFDKLREHADGAVQALNSAEKSTARNKNNHFGFINKRAEWWWMLREALDPVSGYDLALPPDRELFSDLAAPRYKVTPHGVQIEAKEEIIKRIGRSTDKGDSLVYAHVIIQIPGEEYIKFYAAGAGEAEK